MKPAFIYAIDKMYEKEQKLKKQKDRKENSKKAQKEREQLKKKLAQFSKEDYEFLNWALFYTMTEVEKKRGFHNDGEKDQFLRLLYQTNMNGKQTFDYHFNDIKHHRQNYNLTPEDIVNEVQEKIQIENGLLTET